MIYFFTIYGNLLRIYLLREYQSHYNTEKKYQSHNGLNCTSMRRCSGICHSEVLENVVNEETLEVDEDDLLLSVLQIRVRILRIKSTNWKQ